MHIYGLNEKYPNYYNLNIKEMDCGAYFDFSDVGLELHIFFRRPNDFERHDINKGNIRVFLAYVQGVIFFQIKFGNLNWLESPYNVHITDLNQGRPSFEPMQEGYGLSLPIILVDTETGIVKEIRVVSLTTKLSNSLIKTAKGQYRNRIFDEFAYQSLVKEIFQKYTTKDLLKFSLLNQTLIGEEKSLIMKRYSNQKEDAV